MSAEEELKVYFKNTAEDPLALRLHQYPDEIPSEALSISGKIA